MVKTDNINSMIQLCNVTSSRELKVELTFKLLINPVLEKFCAEWNFMIDSDKYLREKLTRE